MSDLASIIARLASATGPDRELDALIWAHFDNRDVRVNDRRQMLAKSRRAPFDECVAGYWWTGEFFAESYVPNVSASLDAAIALMGRVMPGEPDRWHSLQAAMSDALVMWHAGGKSGSFLQHLPRALCLAICRAVQARDAKETGK